MKYERLASAKFKCGLIYKLLIRKILKWERNQFCSWKKNFQQYSVRESVSRISNLCLKKEKSYQKKKRKKLRTLSNPLKAIIGLDYISIFEWKDKTDNALGFAIGRFYFRTSEIFKLKKKFDLYL